MLKLRTYICIGLWMETKNDITSPQMPPMDLVCRGRHLHGLKNIFVRKGYFQLNFSPCFSSVHTGFSFHSPWWRHLLGEIVTNINICQDLYIHYECKVSSKPFGIFLRKTWKCSKFKPPPPFFESLKKFIKNPKIEIWKKNLPSSIPYIENEQIKPNHGTNID